MFCYVYILRSLKNENLYVGFTHNLKLRLAEHNNGLNQSTARFRPWELLYYEAHRNEIDARRREKYLKTSAGGRAISNMLRNDLTKQKVYY